MEAPSICVGDRRLINLREPSDMAVYGLSRAGHQFHLSKMCQYVHSRGRLAKSDLTLTLTLNPNPNPNPDPKPNS